MNYQQNNVAANTGWLLSTFSEALQADVADLCFMTVNFRIRK
jgi:hypothetical protein